MTYTYDETIELLQRAVTEKGDSHKASSQYQRFEDYEPTGEPVCIVGHVLACVDLLSEAIEGDTWESDWQPAQHHFTPAANRALAAAQYTQDGNKTWGEALIAAKEVGL